MKALSRATIILCAGKIDPSNLPIGTNVSNATIPVNGKPVIAWILDDLMRKQVYDVIIVAREEDKKIAKAAYACICEKNANHNCLCV